MSADRSEKATPKRRAEARGKGTVAKSPDLNGSVVLVLGLFAVSMFGPHSVAAVRDSMAGTFARLAHPGEVTSAAGLHGLLMGMIGTVVTAVAPFAAVALLGGVAANVAQVRFRITPAALKPDLRRIDPSSGVRNLFGPQSAFEAIKAIAKVAVVGVIAYLAVVPHLTGLGGMVGMSPDTLGVLLGKTVLSVTKRVAFAYVLIALFDLGFQRWRTERSLRMSKQEVKDEAKEQNLPPEVRSALRRRQIAAARARMMAAVPDADVVVTNPTHFAVALRYDGTRPAPEVVAKGQDLVAMQIRRIAEQHDVPVVEDRPLARALYRDVEVGVIVPEELYQAVAQVLAFVYRTAGRRRTAAA